MRAWSLSILLLVGCFTEGPIAEADDAEDPPGETSTGSDGSSGDTDDDGGTSEAGLTFDPSTGGSTDDAMGDSDTSETTGSDSSDGFCNGMVCPVGCEAELQGGHAYAVCGIGVPNYTAWLEAGGVCEGLGGALLRIETAAENAAVKDAIANHLAAFETAWMGANDRANEATWVWLDDRESDAFYIGGPGQQPLPPQQVVDWAAAEPNNEGPFAVEEDCGALYSAGWLDLPCSNETPFVCEF